MRQREANEFLIAFAASEVRSSHSTMDCYVKYWSVLTPLCVYVSVDRRSRLRGGLGCNFWSMRR